MRIAQAMDRPLPEPPRIRHCDVNYTYVFNRVKKNAGKMARTLPPSAFEGPASQGMIEASDNLGGIRIDRVAEANEDFNCRGILSSFEHADVFAGDAGSRRDFLLGEAGFQTHCTQFGVEHTH